MAMFHCPSLNLKLCPLPEFVKKGEKVRYRSTSYEDFLKQYFAAKLDGRERLERLKLEYYLLDQPAVRLSHAHDVPEYMLMDELDYHYYTKLIRCGHFELTEAIANRLSHAHDVPEYMLMDELDRYLPLLHKT